MKSIVNSLRTCSVLIGVMAATWFWRREGNPPFSTFLFAMSTVAVTLAFVPWLLVVTWWKNTESDEFTVAQKGVLSVLAIANSVYCAALFTTIFSDAQRGLMQVSRTIAVLAFLGLLPLIIKRFDDVSYRYFFFLSILMYALADF
jgi:hypothetical protein